MSAECDGVLARIYDALDGETTVAELAEIHRHLEACPPCLEEYEVEAALKALVRRCCSERAPADLRAKILASITHVETVTTSTTSRSSSVSTVTGLSHDGSTVVARVTRTTTTTTREA
ncbi:mycothiol system anti-sigma-R factor [Quadrisphaera granulorum]|uniref:Mycothiol system anti-sigma-R factor n=1 Tax=Quadrisphaera granulorum TaxID=317664 RepID=A0A316AAQ8_9ACTN|nr:mycothiol system anti-sigma-R factor [Quadrisphaera granulorum]PWJ54865.1 mycothiol system anti-sigma-R factor [Quadrisphaera granulorum]SZE95811.1 mycothiol system anti-sigma-R factor [Quadrisphaera granulorum]